jgi:hypothetical protein
LESSGHGPLTTSKRFEKFFVLISECDETDEIYKEYWKIVPILVALLQKRSDLDPKLDLKLNVFTIGSGYTQPVRF